NSNMGNITVSTPVSNLNINYSNLSSNSGTLNFAAGTLWTSLSNFQGRNINFSSSIGEMSIDEANITIPATIAGGSININSSNNLWIADSAISNAAGSINLSSLSSNSSIDPIWGTPAFGNIH